jgi:hypothetical protein
MRLYSLSGLRGDDAKQVYSSLLTVLYIPLEPDGTLKYSLKKKTFLEQMAITLEPLVQIEFCKFLLIADIQGFLR